MALDRESQRILAERDDVAMIDRPDLWPLAGVLFLKRRADTDELEHGHGFLWRQDAVDGRYVIHDREGEVLQEADSARELVDLGWVVD